jgi:type IV pilus assembly protein PilA
MATSGRGRRGFTLIELMIVVAIVGILAVLATYGVRKYLANAKTTEARNSLGEIGKDALTAYEHESMTSAVLAIHQSAIRSRQLCKGASAAIPGSPGAIKGAKYQSGPGEWNADSVGNSGFSCLKFSMDQPQYYQYWYLSAGGGSAGDAFTAMANGDLNGDQVLSTFSIVGSINSAMGLNLAPNLLEYQPEE